ncbi:MAG: FMN-binding negative transcriptional regulator [Pseudomonadales bacterium]|nr:FMN-binding negative transcriptional regulator [Pseudomonadales bacterium]NRA17254.1 FMN-binding negative transcriptional regulator [Oceanospirillaceae bacterium]
MYMPKHFSQQNWQRAQQLINTYSFTTLITVQRDAQLSISHIPMLYDESEHCLLFHLAAANPHANELLGANATAIFSGPQGYISPNWADQLLVPTWNYSAVHISGKVIEVSAAKKKIAAMAQMADFYEQPLSPGWDIAQLSAVQTNSMIAAIRCFKMSIGQWHGKFKLSQNRSPEAVKQVAQSLIQHNYPNQHNLALAELMLTENAQ